MSSEEENFRRLAVELRILEGTAEALQSRINLLNGALSEMRVANRTLEGMKEEEEGAPLFVPIGGGSFIKAKLESAEQVIVGLGADVSVERTITEAKDNVQDRIEELEETRNNLRQQLKDVIEKIQGHRTELEELTTELRRREKPRSVRKT